MHTNNPRVFKTELRLIHVYPCDNIFWDQIMMWPITEVKGIEMENCTDDHIRSFTNGLNNLKVFHVLNNFGTSQVFLSRKKVNMVVVNWYLNTDIHSLLNFIMHCPNLNHLQFAFFEMNYPASLQNIFEAVMSNPSIKKVSFVVIFGHLKKPVTLPEIVTDSLVFQRRWDNLTRKKSSYFLLSI